MALSNHCKCLVIILIVSSALSIGDQTNQQNIFLGTNPTKNFDNIETKLPNIISRNILQMAHDISAYIIRNSSEKTQVFSPLSIYGALSMLLLGSNADTYTELMQFFHYTDNDLINNSWKIHKELGTLLKNIEKDNAGDEHKIRVVNRLFVQQGFTVRPEFFNAVRDVYRSNTTSLDFIRKGHDATNFINNWVKHVTEGKIPQIISETLSPETKLVMASALHFKALWETSFFVGGTVKRNFYPNGIENPPISVDMMAKGGTLPFYNSLEYDCRIIGLPYKQNKSTMYIILPNNSTKTRLRDLQLMLSADIIADMIAKMEWKTTVMLFPKLHISNEYNLKKVLRELGVYRLFDRQYSDLSLITNSNDRQQVYSSQPSFDNMWPNVLMNDDQLLWKFSSSSNNYAVNSSTVELEDVVVFPRLGEDSADSRNNTNATAILLNNQANIRRKRNIDALKNLDKLRTGVLENPGLFTEEIIHKIDLTVNEKGTDGGAATVTYLYRTGTDVVFRVETPFMFLIQHDRTKLPLFYGTVFEPTN